MARRGEVVQATLAQAEASRRAGRHEEGIALLLDALRYGEAKAQVLFRLGNLYFEQGDLTRAEHAYRRATEEDPRHASAHHNLGVVYRRLGRIAQSVQMLKKARKLELRHPRQVDLALGERQRAHRRVRRTVILLILTAGCVVLVLWVLARST